jgi:hypothetical protein
MNINELTEYCKTQNVQHGYISFPDEVFQHINKENAVALSKTFASDSFMMLPDYEIRFFEWLKINDRKVWDDLWAGTDAPPYITGMAMLPRMVDKTRGFPICDLLENDNYYFAPIHVVQDQAKLLLDSIKERFLNNEEVSTPHIFLMEISLAPIDIWHFAYYYKRSIDEMKAAVEELVTDELLVHITTAEHLAAYVEF